MAERNDGDPAFPSFHADSDGIYAIKNGMSLRDYFAGQVLEAMRVDAYSDNPLYWESVARATFAAADAMLAERERSQ